MQDYTYAVDDVEIMMDASFVSSTEAYLYRIKDFFKNKKVEVLDRASKEWWYQKKKHGIASMEDLYNIFFELGTQEYYARFLDEWMEPEKVIVDYMQFHSNYPSPFPFYLRKNYFMKNMFLYRNSIDSIETKEHKIQLSTQLGTISFRQASDTYVKNDPYLCDILAHHRFSDGCYHCHELSYYLVSRMDATLVTGIIKLLEGKILHSWVEVEDVAIDIAHNLVLLKEDFNRLYHPVVWNTLTHHDIRNNSLPSNLDLFSHGKVESLQTPYVLALKKHYLLNNEKTQ